MHKMNLIRWLRLIGSAILGGFWAGTLVVLLSRWRQNAGRLESEPGITLAEVYS
jgi:hypothetical protein